MERNVALQEVRGAPKSTSNGLREKNCSSNSRSCNQLRHSTHETSNPSIFSLSSDTESSKTKSTDSCSNAIACVATTPPAQPTQFWGKENTSRLIDDSPSLSWSSASSSSNNNDDDDIRKAKHRDGCHLKPQRLLQLLGEKSKGSNSVGKDLLKKKKKDKATTSVIKKSTVEVCVDGKDKVKQQVVLNYLDALRDKLHLRTKTDVQLTVQNRDDDDDFCQVIVPGSTDLRKLGQLLTFLTSGGDGGIGGAGAIASHDDGIYYQQNLTPTTTHQQSRRRRRRERQHHQQQQQSSMKNNSISWFSLLVGDETGANIGDGNSKTMEHLCIENEQTLLLDKSVKIVQIFQGLVMSSNSGMVWDSTEAKEMATYYNSLTWRQISTTTTTQQSINNTNTYYIVIDGILANQSVPDNKILPLPRLVDESCFGHNSMELNRMLHHRCRGEHGSDDEVDDVVSSLFATGRNSGTFDTHTTRFSSSQIINIFDDEESIRMLDPICYADGTVNITAEPYDNATKKNFFSKGKVASAGPPNPGVRSTMIYNKKKKNPTTVDKKY